MTPSVDYLYRHPSLLALQSQSEAFYIQECLFARVHTCHSFAAFGSIDTGTWSATWSTFEHDEAL